MPEFLGIDTSNYTTSAAVFNDENNKIIQKNKLLPVKPGECGLRQSDAVFHHVSQLSGVLSDMLNGIEDLKAVGVSARPRNADGSYMPCFLPGKTAGELIASVCKCDIYYTAHQLGHVAAALYSCGKTELFNESFIAFHVSGGTTDVLLCTPDTEEIIKAEHIGGSLDLKAGQVIDRTGVMMGLDFPCGKELEKLALRSDKTYRIKASLKGIDCCLSGIENQCRKLYESGESKENTANFCISSVYAAIREMTIAVLKKYGNLPLIYSGGVMSCKIIAENISREFGGNFAEPEFSCDNAAGTAVIAAEKYKRNHEKC
ncbi:peptidase M22 [Porcipelethomonas sp.]|uniref:peptidase M22 n=1 Tax=Porcipelethomonas sp. TaxID=2981675 RepID=UPI003EFABD78